ncbi:MAG: hypothetical protein ACE5L7_10840 [Candidatus Aminicenantales bacterium]
MNLLRLLGITPSAESVDYIRNKTQFQLHTLLTEQRHRKTWNLSERIQKSYEDGLQMLLSVDKDIVIRLDELSQQKDLFDMAIQSIKESLFNKQNIYIYGCGATGRLAKQMESAFWRPFWRRVKTQEKIWSKLRPYLGDAIEEQLIGEMTGADRALISSLEGFEDLQLIGRLQLQDRKIKKGDVVICVTEGGETSSVIGTILAALDQWKREKDYDPEKSRRKLFFIYNNPDGRLLPFDRSRKVIEEPGVTKINLTTGPQAITGSTRMQATTIETFVIGNILQAALDRTLREILSKKEMEKLGFKRPIILKEKLEDFAGILAGVKKCLPELAEFTRLETETYESGHFSTYFAQKGLITVFIDSTERSPTFRLYPLDTVKQKRRRCWIQVWTPASSQKKAWEAFLGRPFRGLNPEIYRKPFEEEIEDAYLRKAALESLKSAGDDQRFLYDFSFSEFNLINRSPQPGDLGVVVLLSPEDLFLEKTDSAFRRFIDLCQKKNARAALLLITEKSRRNIEKTIKKIPGFEKSRENLCLVVNIEQENDPFSLDQQIALKILLNAHSTAVMARLGKVIGNTMTNVSPSNLKLIGRATYLVQSHVNDLLSRPDWVKLYGIHKPISYGEANAVLFESMDFLKDKEQEAGQTAEVALSIIRILEALRLKKTVSSEEAFMIVKEKGLRDYLTHVISE